MKTQKRVLFALALIIFVCALCLASCAGKDKELRFGDYRYIVEDSKVTITEYIGDGTEVAIPESINGMPVVAIEHAAFNGCEKIKSLKALQT